MAQMAVVQRVGARLRPGPLWAFVIGGAVTLAAMLLLEQGSPWRLGGVSVGFAVVVTGCIVAVVDARRTAAFAAEEVAVLRLTLEVQEADCAKRIVELEAECSMHSRALARLLDGRAGLGPR